MHTFTKYPCAINLELKLQKFHDKKYSRKIRYLLNQFFLHIRNCAHIKNHQTKTVVCDLLLEEFKKKLPTNIPLTLDIRFLYLKILRLYLSDFRKNI